MILALLIKALFISSMTRRDLAAPCRTNNGKTAVYYFRSMGEINPTFGSNPFWVQNFPRKITENVSAELLPRSTGFAAVTASEIREFTQVCNSRLPRQGIESKMQLWQLSCPDLTPLMLAGRTHSFDPKLLFEATAKQGHMPEGERSINGLFVLRYAEISASNFACKPSGLMMRM